MLDVHWQLDDHPERKTVCQKQCLLLGSCVSKPQVQCFHLLAFTLPFPLIPIHVPLYQKGFSPLLQSVLTHQQDLLLYFLKDYLNHQGIFLCASVQRYTPRTVTYIQEDHFTFLCTPFLPTTLATWCETGQTPAQMQMTNDPVLSINILFSELSLPTAEPAKCHKLCWNPQWEHLIYIKGNVFLF